MKYDCTKTRDCLHEYHRLCDSYPAGCESGCPFIEEYELCGFDIFESEDNIALLQKWSDEHPEKPKITIEEWDFLESFKDKSLVIARYRSGLRLMHGGSWIDLRGMMFSFININQPWTIGELLELEVKDE